MLGDKNSKRRWTLRVSLTTVVLVCATMLLCSSWGGHLRPNGSNVRNVMSMLTLALPFVLTINVLLLAVCLVMRRWWMLSLLAAGFIFSLPTLLVYSPLNLFSKDGTKGSRTIKVMSFNVCEFGPYDQSNHTPSATMRYILDEDADFVLIQEGSQERDYRKLSQTEMMMPELERKYPYHSDGNRDLLVFSKHPYEVIEDTTLKHGNGQRYHYFGKSFDVHLDNGSTIRFVNLHLHSMGMNDSDKEQYLRITKNEFDSRKQLEDFGHSLMSKLKGAFVIHAHEADAVRRLIDHSPDDVIVCGDFNDTPGSWAYRAIRGNDLNDAYSDCALGPTYTFNDHRMYFKIDHILYRGNLRALDCVRKKAGDSDHYPLVATFEITAKKTSTKKI